MPDTLINYIQSRGRARHCTSHFIMLAPVGDTSFKNKHQMLIDDEVKMQQILIANAETPHAVKELGNCVDDVWSFRVESTGAVVTMNNAVSILNDYCSRLPHDRFYKPKIEFEYFREKNGISAKIYLPRPIREDCNVLSGSGSKSKLEAKHRAAFEMVKRLYSFGELDSNLRSTLVSEKKCGNLAQIKASSF
jgi:endoribonuclease Dicer